VISKLYANSFLATLNTRQISQGRGTDNEQETVPTFVMALPRLPHTQDQYSQYNQGPKSDHYSDDFHVSIYREISIKSDPTAPVSPGQGSNPLSYGFAKATWGPSAYITILYHNHQSHSLSLVTLFGCLFVHSGSTCWSCCTTLAVRKNNLKAVVFHNQNMYLRYPDITCSDSVCADSFHFVSASLYLEQQPLDQVAYESVLCPSTAFWLQPFP